MKRIILTSVLLVLQVVSISSQSIASVIDEKGSSQLLINYDPFNSSRNLNLENSLDTSSDSDSGDALCPRSREEAAARGRQCLRKCKTDADCISSRKRCLCDGLCGWSCVRPGKTSFCSATLFMASCGSVPSVSISRYVQHLRVATKLIWMLFRRETYFFTREMLMCLTTCSFPKRLFRWYVIDFHHLYSL